MHDSRRSVLVVLVAVLVIAGIGLVAWPEPARPQQPPQQPNPQPNPAQNSNGPPPPSQSQGNTPKPAPGQTGQEGMTKEQAQQLLGALDEMQRSESQKQHKVRVLRDRHGKDW